MLTVFSMVTWALCMSLKTESVFLPSGSVGDEVPAVLLIPSVALVITVPLIQIVTFCPGARLAIIGLMTRGLV